MIEPIKVRRLLAAGLFTAVAILGCFIEAHGQVPTKPTPARSFAAGVYFAPAYAYKAQVFGGGGTSGAYSVTVFNPFVTLADGRRVNVFSTANSITIGQGAAQETVTPSSVANCGSNYPSGSGQGGSPCTITATFTNAHGPGDIITSGTGGFSEALTDAGQNGGGPVYWEVDCGIITLSTSSATTTTTCNVPKNSYGTGQSVYVTTTITTSASYSLGISGHTTYFMTSCTSLTAATNCSAFIPAPASNAGGTGVGALLVTANATAGAGAARIKVWGYTGAPSTY